MNMQTLISDVADYVGKTITIKGWLYNKRSSGSIGFLVLRDGSGFIQAIVSKNDVNEEVWNTMQELTQESSVVVEGNVAAHPKKENVFELQVSNIESVHVAHEYPISKKEHGPEFLMDNRHIWLRSKRQWAVQRIRDVIISAVYDYYHEMNYIKIDTPIFTPNACEGATELFSVEYFEEGEVYLSQSGQLYLEAAIMSVGRAFDFGPVFRAEKSKTRKHLTEFWMMDAEAAYVEHDENMDLQEGLIKFIVKRCLERCKTEFTALERDTSKLERLLELPFERLSYTDAINKLQGLGSEIKFGDDLSTEDEGLLTNNSEVPVFVHKWPKSIKPFYMKADPENPELVLNDDLLGIEDAGEIIGGSQREDDFEILKAAIEEEGLWSCTVVFRLKKYGSVPHSGYGLGLERMVRWMSGVYS